MTTRCYQGEKPKAGKPANTGKGERCDSPPNYDDPAVAGEALPGGNAKERRAARRKIEQETADAPAATETQGGK